MFWTGYELLDKMVSEFPPGLTPAMRSGWKTAEILEQPEFAFIWIDKRIPTRLERERKIRSKLRLRLLPYPNQ